MEGKDKEKEESLVKEKETEYKKEEVAMVKEKNKGSKRKLSANMFKVDKKNFWPANMSKLELKKRLEDENEGETLYDRENY